MADEARNTGKRPRFGGQDAKLRHRPVSFVSAGLMNPMEELEKELEVEQDVTQTTRRIDKPVEKLIMSEVPEDADTGKPKFVSSSNVPVPSKEKTTVPPPPLELFVVDTTGDSSLRPKKLDSLPFVSRDESDQDSDSSEEVILFKGRDAALRTAAQSTAQSRHAPPLPRVAKPPVQSPIKPRGIDVEMKAVERIMEQTTITSQSDIQRSMIQETEQVSMQETPLAEARTPKVAETSLLDALLDPTESDEERALVADYIANMDNDDEDDDDDEEDEETDAHPGLGSHAFHILRDLGGSDSDAVPEPITDDDTDENASDDEEAATTAEASVAQRQQMELDDAHLARMLAKQEELGFGGDDVMLFDGGVDEDEDGNWRIAPKATPRRKKKASAKQAKIVQKKGEYPSATAMADAFDDLDLMDWRRAALNNVEQVAQRFSKHSPPEHDDPDMQEAMQLTWKKDRLKKAEKKKQREALRAQGLLGKNINPDDLRVKYLVGMSKDELVEELEQFLLGHDEQYVTIFHE